MLSEAEILTWFPPDQDLTSPAWALTLWLVRTTEAAIHAKWRAGTAQGETK